MVCWDAVEWDGMGVFGEVEGREGKGREGDGREREGESSCDGMERGRLAEWSGVEWGDGGMVGLDWIGLG